MRCAYCSDSWGNAVRLEDDVLRERLEVLLSRKENSESLRRCVLRSLDRASADPAAVSPTGGAETQIFLLARALVRAGSKVCLLVFDLPEITIRRSLTKWPSRCDRHTARIGSLADFVKRSAFAEQ